MDEEFEILDKADEPEEKASEEKDAKSVSSDLIRGHINTIILRSLADGDKYGYEIIAEIERKSHGQYSLKQPSLYSALKRLESQGYVTSYWGGSVGGGRRKYFSLSDEGVKIAEQNQSEWEYSRTIIDSLISDKDFDFSNPAPSLVNMRMLKSTTSRVPSRESDGEGIDYEPSFPLPQNSEEQEKLKAELEEKERELAEQKTALETERARYEETLRILQEREATILSEKQSQAKYYAERERLYQEEKYKNDALMQQRAAEKEAIISDELILRDEAFQKEREHYEMLLVEKEAQLEEERSAHQRALVEQEALIRKQAHDEIQHQNYLNLVNTPPPAPARQTAEYNYYTSPVVEEKIEENRPATLEELDTGYRPIVRKMYENSVQPEPQSKKETKEAQALDGVSFRDIEERAAEDGIRITTAGKKSATTERSASLVHKGKALFLSALVVFFLCIAEGGIVLAVRDTYSLSLFYPYFIWAMGLAVLLVTGLAYANHFGERSLRKHTPALINAIVLYALAVIVTLIIALGVNIDFQSPSALAAFVVIPIIFLFGIVVFGIIYYIQVRPKKD